ncbi:MAG: Gfo/Idh/MocA family oxidoreductase [Verrucomicrobia subdivision 3 bacterium]|nr:Gfo/Idh/MocA family oxidoreductase [Limisphaerales bacterium]
MAGKLRIAILGVDHPHGMGWRESLTHVANELEITAIMPAFDNGTASLEERLTHLPRFETVEALLAEGGHLFDAALVCLQNNVGPDAVIQLAQAGKHIVLEKPGAANANDARQMADAVRANKVAFQSGYLWRYDELANRLRAMVARGSFGKLISVEMTWTTSNIFRRDPGHYLFDSAQSGGGFFNWLGCHHLDLLHYITGETITGITARVGNFSGSEAEVEDGGSAILDLAGGGLATFTGGYWHPRWQNDIQWNLRGTQRWVHWDPSRSNTGGALEIHGPQPQFLAMEESFELPPDTTTGYGGKAMVNLLEDWLRAIREGTDCRNTPESTVAVLETIDTIYEASNTARRVECAIASK